MVTAQFRPLDNSDDPTQTIPTQALHRPLLIQTTSIQTTPDSDFINYSDPSRFRPSQPSPLNNSDNLTIQTYPTQILPRHTPPDSDPFRFGPFQNRPPNSNPPNSDPPNSNPQTQSSQFRLVLVQSFLGMVCHSKYAIRWCTVYINKYS